jgi:monofunctional biosynthetic peptidoglycan transglycosylase
VVFSIAATIIAGYIGIRFLTPVCEVRRLRNTNPEESAFMQRYKAEVGTEDKNDTLKHIFIPLDSVSRHLVNTVIAAEDDGFYLHPGFDIAAILSAVEYNKRHRANKRGASTISQQVAKNMFLGPKKTFSRKYRELAYTILMEHFLGKERILELYLNYAQWGKNIFGCEAAAQHYFNKSSSDLTLSEAARMASVLAMPTRISPHYTASSFMGKRLAVIAHNLYLKNMLSDSNYLMLCGRMPPGAEPDSTENGESAEEGNTDEDTDEE